MHEDICLHLKKIILLVEFGKKGLPYFIINFSCVNSLFPDSIKFCENILKVIDTINLTLC